MADNLLEMAIRQLGSSGLGALGGALGLPQGNEESAVNTGVASVLAGMLNKGGSKTGLTSLFNMITDSKDLDFSSIGDIFSDPGKMSSLQQTGGSMLDTVFGSKSSDLGSVISSALGVGGNTGGSLLKVAAPVVMSLLSKLIKSKGLDMSGLASLLFGQKPHIKGKLPDGLLKTIGVHDFEDLGQHLDSHGHAEPLTARPKEPVKKRGGFGKWFWPLLIALAALYALNMCAKKEAVEDKPGEVILEEEQVMVEEKPDTVAPATGETVDFASSFRDYLTSAARDPNREFPLTIEFEVDSATVTSASVPDVEALAKIMQENPGLTISVEGHTSSEGDEMANQELSQERADTVRQMLVEKGIDPNRVTATGMGSAKPVADNSTEEGKQKNRRISVKVVTFE